MKSGGKILTNPLLSHANNSIHARASDIVARCSQSTKKPCPAAPTRSEIFGLVSLLKKCSQANSLADGRLVHAHIIKKRYNCNVFLGNWLVYMYGECGSMDDAQAVFDSLPVRNLYSWTILMKAYVNNERFKEALDCFDRMKLQDMKPDPYTFVSALEACANLEALAQGQEIHAAMLRDGCESEVIVGTALVNMYGKCGSVQSARRVFGQMPERNVVTWNAIIAAYSQNGHTMEALQLLHQMQYNDMTPDKITLICILDACAHLAILEIGQQIHAAVVERGYEGDLVIGNALVNMYGKCGILPDARRVFHQIPKRNVASWNAMIAACAQNDHGMEALEMFHHMHYDGIKPNQITFLCALDACVNITGLYEGHKIHAAIVESGYEDQLVVGNALINMYGKCHSYQDARNVFNQMSEWNVVSWNTMISVCTQNGYCKEALDYYDQMQDASLKPNCISFLGALDACTRLAALEKGKEIHGAIIDGGCEELTMVGNALINMYGHCGALLEARRVFGQMRRRDVISWNAMIAACTRNGQAKDALHHFLEMKREDIKPNEISFVCALDACASLAMLDKGQEIHSAIVDGGYEGQIIVGTALLNMYGKCGSFQNARNVFSRLPKHDVVCWNAMIATCAQNGHDKQALDFFHLMLLDGIKPNDATFLSVLTACSHAGQVDNGWQYFLSMSQGRGMQCTVEHHKCLFDILVRAGHLDEAEGLIKTMTFLNEAAS